MSDSAPIQIQIRKTIYEKFNDPDGKFNNDEIFDALKNNGNIDPSLTIDDMEKYFLDICNSGLARNIAQNFTTIWMKLFDVLEEHHCNSCDLDVHVGVTEEKICPNPLCKAKL